nr:chromate resistance protein ChrB domain-containing protein [uncultured Desulfobacter sp.]
MNEATTNNWLLLIHQIPPKPNAFRVKIWRRLQQIGAVSIKQSVYAMPLSDESREDLGWILKEIIDGGGDGSIIDARFIEGLTDEQIVAIFQNARKTDYEKIISEAMTLRSNFEGALINDPPVQKKLSAVSRLNKRFKEIVVIDFFNAPERGTAEILIENLFNIASGPRKPISDSKVNTTAMNGKIWVTRKNVFVDRMACGWLIRRFIDSEAKFLFADGNDSSSGVGHIRFDMHGGEYTHQGDKCSFEVMAETFCPQDKAVTRLSEMVHDIDLKEAKFGHTETEGFNAMLIGVVACEADDMARMEKSMAIFEHMYAYFLRK